MFAVRLVCVVLLLDLFVTAMALVSLRDNRSRYAERAAVQSQNLCQALASSMKGIIDTTDVTLLAVVDEAEKEMAAGRIDAKALNAYIKRLHQRLPELDSIRMATASGEIAYGTGLGRGARKTVADREYFREVRDNPQAQLVVSRPVLGRISGKWVVVAARRVNNPDGSFGGVVYGPITLEKIQNVLSSIKVGPSGGISLRYADGSIVVRHPTMKSGYAIGQKLISDEFRKRLQARSRSGTFFTPVSWDNTAKTVSYLNVGTYPLFIIVGLASRDYLAPWQSDLGRSTAFVLLFVAVTVILSCLVYRWWLREKIAREGLWEAKAELELRVAERTAELFAVNDQLVQELAERQLAEEMVRQSRNTLAQIIDAIPQAVFWKDRESVYLGCNTVFAGKAGYQRADGVVGKTDYDLPWLPEESQAYRLDDREVMKQNAAKLHIIEQQLQADGSRVWVDTTKVPLCDDHGEVYGVLGVYEDITQRKAVEDARDKALTLFESLLISSPTGIQVFDGDSGDCVIVNDSLVEMIGGSREAMLTQNFRRLSSWREAGIDTMAEEVLAGFPTRHREKEVVSTFGKLVHLDFFLTRCDVDGRPHLMMIAQDVSESKRLELENKRIAAQMLHVQKLESLGVLAGGIAHDFNNILMVVVGNTDLALMNCGDESPVRENLVQIEQAATRASELARQMLAYSGKGRFVIEELDLSRIVREMVQMLEVSVSKKVEIEYRFPPELPAISGDVTQLRQVILNLVLNAAEAIGENSGSIAIGTGFTWCDRACLADTWIDDGLPEGGYVVMEVSDSGCGMEREVMAKIFDPFFTTKFTGRGLGMAAVLGIVRGHKGAIKVCSENGKGTTFKLFFPALAQAADRSVAPPVEEEPCEGTGTVLLVDDEQAIRAVGEDMLRALGFTPLIARDGREALEIYAERQEEIGCVLLDLTMPVLDGEQTLNELRRLDPGVKVIVASGYSGQDISRRFSGQGTAFIQKPYKLVEVSRKLREMLG